MTRTHPQRIGGHVLRVAVAVLLMQPAAAFAQEFGMVRGVVRAEETGAPFSGAIVEVVGMPTKVVVTDTHGRYRLESVPSGRRLLRARHVGHAAFEFEVFVPTGGTVSVDMSLRVQPIIMEAVEVAAEGVPLSMDTVGASSAELGFASARALGSGTGITELGLADAIDPAQPEDPEVGSVLFIRGTGTDLKLVYLDGAPVHSPFPLGGLIPAFSPGMIGSAETYRGGAPARFDGGLSYVMDLRTRAVRKDRPRTAGSLDLMGARVLVETPLASGTSLLASIRGVHGEGLREPLPYGYREAMVRADMELPSGFVGHATAFLNDERTILVDDDPSSAVSWGNAAGSIRVNGRVGGNDAEVTAALGSYNATLPLAARDGGIIDGAAIRARLTADLTSQLPSLVLRYGAGLDRLVHEYRAELRDGAVVTASAVGSTVGAYVDGSWRAAKRLTIRSGVRLDHFGYARQTAFAPRFSITYVPAEHVSLTLAGGRYHQYVRTPENEVLFPRTPEVGESPDSTSPRDPLGVGVADHLSAAVDQQITPGLHLGLEGFYKSFSGVPTLGNRESNASGVDVWLRRESGRVRGWAGYSLAWVWSGADGDAEGDQFAGRHLLTAGVGSPVTEAIRLDASFTYGSGLPYSAIPISAVNAGDPAALAMTTGQPGSAMSISNELKPAIPTPERQYLRLDVSASHEWSGRVRGHPVNILSYLKLLNTLGQRDAIFYRYDDGEELKAIAAMPIVPVLGIEWSF